MHVNYIMLMKCKMHKCLSSWVVHWRLTIWSRPLKTSRCVWLVGHSSHSASSNLLLHRHVLNTNGRRSWRALRTWCYKLKTCILSSFYIQGHVYCIDQLQWNGFACTKKQYVLNKSDIHTLHTSSCTVTSHVHRHVGGQVLKPKQRAPIWWVLGYDAYPQYAIKVEK